MVGTDHFIEVYVDTPLAVCEAHDNKGMYRQAREGKIKNFTGIDDPYEPPIDPEIRIDTVSYTAEENTAAILSYLVEQGFLLPFSAEGEHKERQ
jgi:sulfate adenylyltransferase